MGNTESSKLYPSDYQGLASGSSSIVDTEKNHDHLLATQPPRGPAVTSQSLLRDGNLKSFQFLKIEPICRPSDIIAAPRGSRRVAVSKHAIIYSTNTTAVIINFKNHTVREVSYDFKVNHWYQVSHSLSPDQKILVRWRRHKHGDRVPWIIEAINTRSNTVFSSLPGLHLCTHWDGFQAVWSSNKTICIIDSQMGFITIWTIGAKQGSTSIIHPLPIITQHKMLRFNMIRNGRWWIANGRTEHRKSPCNGLIQIHDTHKNDSRVIPGVAFCVAEAEMYGKKKDLIVTCNTDGEMLSVNIEQLDKNAPGKPFEQVGVSVALLISKDVPGTIRVLERLPIIVVNTFSTHACQTLYFFELYTGTYLFAQTLAPGVIYGFSDDNQSLLVHQDDGDLLCRVSVNEDDLVSYVRHVLGNDILASEIATRTGLKGAQDDVFSEKYGEYKSLEDGRALRSSFLCI